MDIQDTCMNSKDEYANMPVDVQKDEEKGLYYVQKERKEATLFQKKHSSQENSKIL